MWVIETDGGTTMTHKLDILTLDKLVNEAFADYKANRNLRFGQALWNVLPFFCIDYFKSQEIDLYYWTDYQIDEIIGLVYEHLLEE